MNPSVFTPRVWCLVSFLAALSLALPSEAQQKDGDPPTKKTYRGVIGPDSEKIRVEGDKTFVWGGKNPKTGEEEWYDFTGAPFAASELQFGIGKYRIVAIDDPVYVKPTDQRLMAGPVSPYRKDERPSKIDEIMVIGWAEGDDVRAYPISLLDRHELVNDTIGGKPVTVGW